MAFGARLDIPEVLSLWRKDFAVPDKQEEMHLQWDWISTSAVETFPTLSPNPVSFKGRKTQTTHNFLPECKSTMNWNLWNSLNSLWFVWETLYFKRISASVSPADPAKRRRAGRISASFLLLETSVSLGMWKWKITFKNMIWRTSISRSCAPKWSRYETEIGQTKERFSLTLLGWECGSAQLIASWHSHSQMWQ